VARARLRRLLAAGLAALTTAAAAGCRKAPGGCLVTGMSVADPQSAALDSEDLRRAAIQAFQRTPGFRVELGEEGRGARRCRATVALLDARVLPSGATEALVALSLVAGEEEAAMREVARYAEPLRVGEGPAEALRRAVAGASGRAAAALGLALAEADKPTAELLRDLESSDPRTRDLSVRVLAERRSPAAVPALLERLADPDPAVVERAVGALAQIRDPRAVGPLIGLTQRREGSFVTQVVLIIGDIGGAEAEAYLDTLAAGHPDPAVRSAAREALASLRARERTRPSSTANR